MQSSDLMKKMSSSIHKYHLNKLFNSNQMEECEQEEEQYEQLTIELIKQNKKFIFQEKANDYYQTSYGKDLNSTQTTLLHNQLRIDSSIHYTNKQTDFERLKQMVQTQSDPIQFLKSYKTLIEWSSLSIENRPKLNLVGLSKLIGQGSQGEVRMDFLQFDYSSIALNENFSRQNVIPVALKQIQDSDQFKREVMIMEQLKYEYQPRLIYCDHQKQVICMELCICTLEEFSMMANNTYLQQDLVSASLLLRLMNRIITLITTTNIIHGDIKPSNIAFTIRNEKKQVELILLDFGASSNSLYDYCNYYTQAFCHHGVLQKIINDEIGILDIDTIIFNELFCACRAIQFALLKGKKSLSFDQSQFQLFSNQFEKTHPITLNIIAHFFANKELAFSYTQFNEMLLYYNNIFQDCFDIDIKYLLANSQKYQF